MHRLATGVVLVTVLSGNVSAQLFQPGFEAPGLAGGVFALVAHNDGSGPRLYAAGDFDAAGSTSARNIARWNGQTSAWSAVGGGIQGRVGALVVFDEDQAGPQPARLFAAGSFAQAGAASANNVARWNGVAWSPLSSGTDDTVTALAVFDDDGPGPRPSALYAAGLFRHAGGLPANGIARWNGATWEALGVGLGGPATSLAVFDTDGPFGTGAAELYAGGHFDLAGGLPVSRLARWNGSNWLPVGSGVDIAESAPSVNALAVFDVDGPGLQPARLFLGGSFQFAGPANANGVASWDGVSFGALSSGLTANGSFPNVRAFGVFDDGSGARLYAAGLFRTAGTATAQVDGFNASPFLSVARWDGSTWTPLGAGSANNANGVGRALAFFDDDANGLPSLFVGGQFTAAGAGATHGVAKWNGTSWVALGLGRGVGGDVHAIVEQGPGAGAPLAVGGSFTTAGSVLANRVALYSDVAQSWQALGVGVDDTVRALEFHAGALHAGGDFETSGGAVARHVARFDGGSWVQVGGGTDGDVHALETFEGTLVAGGSFQHAGPALAGNVARWNGASWGPLGSGTDDVVRALETFEEFPGVTVLFAGGDFTRAGGTSASGVARWDGASWTRVGGGLCCGGVLDFAVFDDGGGPRLYAAGDFDVNGNGRSDNVVRWNAAGQTWEIVGGSFAGGTPTRVHALSPAVIAGNPCLVAGGEFTSAAGVPAQNLACWNGSAWNALGSGADGVVLALRSHAVLPGGTALFAGGAFAQIDGRVSARFARTN